MGDAADAAAGFAGGSASKQSYQSCQLPEEDPDKSYSQSGELQAWTCNDEFWYAWYGGEDLLVDIILPFVFCSSLDESALRKAIARNPLLTYNPVWYALILAMVVILVPGHLFQALFGNGETLRADELEIETRIRTGWVYTYSGSFILMALVYGGIVLEAVAAGLMASDWKGYKSRYLMAISVFVLYLAGDAHLLFQMRRRNTIMTHACAYAQMSFGLAFCLDAGIGLFHYGGAWHSSPKFVNHSINYTHFYLTCTFCVFMGLAIIGYSPLLYISYEERRVKNPPPPWALWFCGVLAAIGPASIVIVFAILASFGHFGIRPVVAVVAPFLVVVAGVLCRCAAYSFTWERVWATLVALGPLLLVFGSFSIVGPHLWACLSGS